MKNQSETVIAQVVEMFAPNNRDYFGLPQRPNFNAMSFPARVRYAAWAIMAEKGNDRNFDTCFEMYDGTAVVVALVRVAQRVDGFRDKLSNQNLTAEGWQKWQDIAAKFAHLSDGAVHDLASKLRNEGRVQCETLYRGEVAHEQAELAL